MPKTTKYDLPGYRTGIPGSIYVKEKDTHPHDITLSRIVPPSLKEISDLLISISESPDSNTQYPITNNEVENIPEAIRKGLLIPCMKEKNKGLYKIPKKGRFLKISFNYFLDTKGMNEIEILETNQQREVNTVLLIENNRKLLPP